MIRNLSIILSLGLGACVSAPAPGTRPADMTAQAHVQACRSHEQRAEALETAERYNTNEGYSDAESRAEFDVAKQHGRAAKAADPNAPVCP
jgi:hypothetical protein